MARFSERFELLRHLKPQEIVKRAIRKPFRYVALRWQECQARKLAPNAPTDEEVLRALSGSVNREDFIKSLRHDKRPVLFSCLNSGFWDSFRQHYPEVVDRTFHEADKVCQHTFDLLGSGPTNLGPTIDWHRDFKSGQRFDPQLYYRRLHMDNLPGADILVPWWLSSFYHLMSLGKANFLAKDGDPERSERYTEEFQCQVSKWFEGNPYLFGVNWCGTTAVTIRLINLIWGYSLFRGSPSITDDFWWKYVKQLYLHARHVRRHLEWFPVRTNHYLSNLTALLYMGLLFPEFSEAGEWRELAHNELISEIEHHAYADGVGHEGSLNYHRFATEIFAAVLILGKRHGLEFPPAYLDRLEKMMSFIMHYSCPDGTAPRVGDAATITLQDLGQTNLIGDHRWLLAIGAVIFNRPDFKAAAGDVPEAMLWLLGPEGLRTYDEIPIPESKSLMHPVVSRSFPEGGFHVIRGDSLYILIRCGPLGLRGVRGHGHYDQLSFELWADGEPIMIDPGWYCYEADKAEMQRFKSTAGHNTVVVDGLDQVINDLFIYPPPKRPQPELLDWQVKDDVVQFCGEHRLYSHLPQPVRHQRKIEWFKKEKYVLIEDVLEGEGIHNLEWHFHAAPDVSVSLADGEAQFLGRATRVKFKPVVESSGAKGVLRVQQNEVALQYGVKQSASVLSYQVRSLLPISVQFMVQL